MVCASGGGPMKTHDITIESDSGSIFLLRPVTGAGRNWVDRHIGQDNGFQPYWPTVVVEARYLEPIVEGLLADGIRLRWECRYEATIMAE